MFKHASPILGIAAALLVMSGPGLVQAEPAAARDETQFSVAQRLTLMDRDHDGIVSVYEVRAFIESVHGKGYQQDVLDTMEASASGKSCSTPFAKSL